MASPNIYSGGLGGSTGAEMATASPVLTSGTVYYLGNQSNGSDSYAGTDRLKPLATLSAAYTAMSAGDTLYIMENHSETLSSAQTLGKAGISLLGEGSGTTAPRFTCSGTVNMLDITAAGILIDNIRFPESTAAATARVRTAAAFTRIVGCYFECGASDTAAAVKFITGSGTGTVEDCTFISTTTAIATLPAIGLEVANAASDLVVQRCTFDGGTYGWSDYAFKGTAAITRLYGHRVKLLRGSDVYFATGTTGTLNTLDPSGSARVVWTA